MRFAFAGDRDISVWVLELILSKGVKPLALLVSGGEEASHANDLIARCSFLDQKCILAGMSFREPTGVELLHQLDLHYIVCVHFPYVVPKTVLSIPRDGVLNLHPAYLPFNRGWHTPTWGMLEDTPVGATLHFMDSGIDTGDIVHQKALVVSPGDTGDSLYQKLKRLELEVFKEAWPQLISGAIRRKRQDQSEGTEHSRQELFQQGIQQIDLNEETKAGDLIRRLRALTTNRIEEAAYYQVNGKRYRIQVRIQEEKDVIEE